MENKAKPAIKSFLDPRGLRLSDEKTLITNIDDGFDFLGFNVRKYKGKLLIKPSKKTIKAFVDKIRETINSMRGAKPEALIAQLNPIIRGWVNYHKHVVAKKTFGYVDWQIDKMLWKWARKRHPKKSSRWIKQKYFPTYEYIGTTFVARVEIVKGEYRNFALVKASWTPIQRHIKVRQEANPFNPKYNDYFKKRQRQHSKLAWKLMKLDRETAFIDAEQITALEPA